MNLHLRIFLLLVGVFLVPNLFAQTGAEGKLIEFRKRADQFSRAQYQLAKEYAERNNIPMISYDSRGNAVVLVGMDDETTPRFITVDNAGAAVTTGVTTLREGGSLGLNLQGEGMVVGVWDGGAVVDHVEFDDRLLQTEGTSLSDHSTHVTGTIMASGINANAKGMAPRAAVLAFDFDNDLSEMASRARADQSTLLFSNHSYGAVLGWRFDAGTWSWFGNSSISNNEDYRFGFYSTATRSWDELAFNAPYYTICKSAGNDRSDTGSANHPADCDGGSGFDCIGDVATAKNIITVGAVGKVQNYSGPSSVVMSSFSSWGPTDDGRIKPDIVGAGVNLFSTFSTSSTAYGTLSGTSMASPNVTGSLVLLQELYQKIHGNYMRAATLKALAIHSAKEAGLSPGPDYRFGWGLLDVEAGAKIILDEDDANVIIEEGVLTNGQVFELNLTPVANKKITATIVWTDPAGTPVASALDPTNLMLVNDLDMRIVDDNSIQVLPWTLNPAEPNEAAQAGDDFRNNVEKIEFENPQPRTYKLQVRHKGTLAGGQQAFSLILQYTSLNDPSVAYYWIDGSGDWNDPAHWSLTSGGTSAGVVPGIDDRTFFDENSFDGISTIALSANAACASAVWLTDEEVTLQLNDHDLTVAGNFIVNAEGMAVSGSGRLVFTGSKNAQNIVTFSETQLPMASLVFDGDAAWQLRDLGEAKTLILRQGNLVVTDDEISVSEFLAESENAKTLDLSSCMVKEIKSFVVVPSVTLRSQSTRIVSISEGSTVIDLAGKDFKGTIEYFGSNNLLKGDNKIQSLLVNGAVLLNGSNTISKLELGAGASFKLEASTTQTLSSDLTIHSTATLPVSITANQLANIRIEEHTKLCFDYLVVTNVALLGEAVISAGLNSVVTAADNWKVSTCNEILFADFAYQFGCAGALTSFTSTSTGQPSEWEWDFGDSSSGNTSDLAAPVHVYSTPGVYTVTLTVRNDRFSDTYSKNVTITSNDMAANRVVESNGLLYSFNLASSYQWYKDNQQIDGATSRSYDFNDQGGVYFVVTKNQGCNRVSDVFTYVVLDVESGEVAERIIYPNPVEAGSMVTLKSRVPARVAIIDMLGKTVKEESLKAEITSISTVGFQRGLYTLLISSGGNQKQIIRLVVK